MSSLCQNPDLFICILYQNIIFSDSASYFLEMSMLIILVGTMTQLRMGVGCITFPRMGGVNMLFLCQIKKRKLRWYCHISRSSGKAKTILSERSKKERKTEE